MKQRQKDKYIKTSMQEDGFYLTLDGTRGNTSERLRMRAYQNVFLKLKRVLV
jgi:hypothetical protein